MDIVKSQFESAGESPGFLLWRTSIIWRRKIERALIPYKLTHTQFVLLTAVWDHTQGEKIVSQSELSAFTGCDRTMTSQVLRALEKKKLIERVRRENDERSKFPRMTRLGATVLRLALETVEQVDKAFFGTVQAELPELIRLLRRLSGY